MPEAPVRVLIVDDSTFYRRAVERALTGVPGIEVVGCSHSGRTALVKLRPRQVDLITLDMNMPDMDGLETLRVMQRDHHRVRVLLLSGHSGRGAARTIQALCLGAEDFVPKPRACGDSLEELRRLLVPRILRQLGAPARRPSVESSPPQPAPSRARNAEALVIGASTGGPQALHRIFQDLPALDCEIFIVQHMPAIFTASLAQELARYARMEVREARDGERVERGVAYLAPGGMHMQLEERGDSRWLRVHRGPRVNFCRPSVDLLFESAARIYGPGCLGLVLTGMGYDGLEGSRAVVQNRGEVLAQDQATSVVWGMPRAVVDAGLARPLPLAGIAPALVERVRARQRC